MTEKHPRRRGLNELMESVAAKLAERPDHIAAAKVLEEMNADAARQAQEKKEHKAHDAGLLETQIAQKVSAQNVLPDCPPTIPVQLDRATSFFTPAALPAALVPSEKKDVQPAEPPPVPARRKVPRQTARVLPDTSEPDTTVPSVPAPPAEPQPKKTVTLRPSPSPVHGGNAVKLFRWLFQVGKNNTLDLTLPIAEEATGIDARSCRRILASWTAAGVCEKTIHRRGLRIRLLLTEKEALGVTSRKKSSKNTPKNELEKALPDLCPRLVEAGFSIKHLRRIRELLAMQQLEADGLPEALRYAEFELEHDQMIDSRGDPVSSPVDWVFRCLSKDGTYRVPKNFLSPAERQRREREKVVRRERETLEAERTLRQEEATLALEKEVEAQFQQILASPEGELAARYLEQIPAFLREKGITNPLVQRACRMQISLTLNRAAKTEKA